MPFLRTRKGAVETVEDASSSSPTETLHKRPHTEAGKRPGLVATLSSSFRRKSPSNQKTAEEEEEPTSTQESELSDAPATTTRRRKLKKKPLLWDASDQDDDDDDPVMAVFEARARQRVRFAAEPMVQDETPTPPQQEQAATTKPDKPKENQAASFGIHKFMKNALFGKGTDESEEGLQKEIAKAKKEVVWEAAADPAAAPDLVRTRSGRVAVSFTEDPLTKAKVNKLLNKARRAVCVHYRYAYAVKCHVKAMEYLKKANYPDNHPLTVKVAAALANSHHALSSLNTSAGIVKMGLKYEQAGELVRALKMYTIAFRIRRDSLSRSHPSLVVLLNMLGSIQVKRGELDEAMQIYQLALQDDSSNDNDSSAASSTSPDILPGPTNLLARAVTYRELGTIYEEQNKLDKALQMYEKSLECLADYKLEQMQKASMTLPSPSSLSLSLSASNDNSLSSRLFSPTAVDLDEDGQASTPRTKTSPTSSDQDGMEILIQELAEHNVEQAQSPTTDETPRPENFCIPSPHNYASFFPPQLDPVIQSKNHRRKKKQKQTRAEKQHDQVNVDAALTLHQIAQLHRSRGDYQKALSVYEVAIRGMKYCLGRNHPNVAAILGNIGNLQKEMGDLDSAFDTYQQVLGIESYRLGLSHPDVAITLHNIATIDAARGKHDHAIALYGQVINLQRKLFGPDHASVAVTAACLADVYDRIGDMKGAVKWYEEATRIKTVVMGRHSLEVARLLHKLGKLASARLEYHLADSLVSRAILIYRLNKLPDDDEWMVDACRDAADSEAAIAMGKGVTFEC